MKNITLICIFSFPVLTWANIDYVLQSKSQSTSASLKHSIICEQSRQQEKLKLQLQIYALRSQIGSATDTEEKHALQNKLTALEKQRRDI